MLFRKDEDLELRPKRKKTLVISIGIHAALFIILILFPDLLNTSPKRIIRIMSQDYDLSKQQLTELVAPPDSLRARPTPPVPQQPLVQPPQPQTPPPPQQQTPPPPPPPPPPQQPPPVIGPDDILKEGARPDARPNASRGNTTEQARAGGQQEESKPETRPPQQIAENRLPPPITPNTNPNALRGPSLSDSANRFVREDIERNRSRTFSPGPRTGTQGGQADPNFSTEETVTILSDTRGYDFGPYMNQVISRVRQNWYTLIPEIARLGKQGRVVIVFTITKSGSIKDARVVVNSGTEPLDRAAFGSITLSNPFSILPPGFDGDRLDLQFTFLYNIR